MTLTDMSAVVGGDANVTTHVVPGPAVESSGHDRTVVWIVRLLVPVLVAGGWSVASRFSDLVPDVIPTFEELIDGFGDGWLMSQLRATAHVVAVGFLLAVATALPLGLAVGRSPYWFKTLEPLVAAGYSVPRIIIYPILLSYFGVNPSARIGVVAVSAFFPIIVTSMVGAREVDQALVKLGRSLGMGNVRLARTIILPAAAPTIMFGLRIGFSIGFIGVVLAEMFSAKEGLGTVVADSYALLRVERMFAVVLLIVVFAFAVNITLWWLERRLRHEHEGATS